MICPKCNSPMLLLFTSYVCDHCPQSGQDVREFQVGQSLTKPEEINQALLQGYVVKEYHIDGKMTHFYRYVGTKNHLGTPVAQVGVGSSWTSYVSFGTGSIPWLFHPKWSRSIAYKMAFAIGDRVQSMVDPSFLGGVTHRSGRWWAVLWDGYTDAKPCSASVLKKVSP